MLKIQILCKKKEKRKGGATRIPGEIKQGKFLRFVFKTQIFFKSENCNQ